MSSPPPDQTAVLSEILETLKTLQLGQVNVASNVDAIAGRVNVLAGMKEVREVAASDSSSSTPVSILPQKGDAVASLPAAYADDEMLASDAVPAAHARKSSTSASTATSRIILT